MEVDLYEILKSISEEKLFCKEILRFTIECENNDFMKDIKKIAKESKDAYKLQIYILSKMQRFLLREYKRR